MTDIKNHILRDKWTFAAYAVKAVTGVVGTSLVLEQNHPYLTVFVLAIGAVANEAITFYKLKN